MGSPERVRFLRLIGAFKLFKALVLVGSLATLFQLIRQDDPARTLIGWAMKLHVDPANQYLRAALAKLVDVDDRQLEVVAAGTVVYAILFSAEGVGLLLARVWAEYLTIVVTSGFIPLELYEIVKKFNVSRTIVLLLNVAVVIYLIAYVHRHRTLKTP